MKEDYEKARKLGEKQYRKGNQEVLEILDNLVAENDCLSRRTIGIHEIPLSFIKGTCTAGRANAFSKDFLPLMDSETEFAHKWSSLYDSIVKDGLQEPICVEEYMHHFYVREGNKRVSVLKYLDVPSIDADIIRIMPRDNGSQEYRLYQEFLAFYRVCPLYDFYFSESGSYQRLISLLKQSDTEKWSDTFLNTLRGAYFRFARVVEEKNRTQLDLNTSDAFLFYLEIYGFDSLLDKTRYDLSNRVDLLWEELLFRMQHHEVSLIEEPLAEGTKGLFSNLFLFNENRKLRILFLYDKDPLQSVWSADHENGRIYLDVRYNGKVTTSAEVVSPDVKVTKEYVQYLNTYDVVFSTSSALQDVTLRLALECPQVRFFHCGRMQKEQAYVSYYGRMYEAMYLLGRIAATYAGNHKIGYLSTSNNYAEENAFAIGAAMVDPKAEVYIKHGIDADVFHDNPEFSVYCGQGEMDEAGMPVYGVQVKNEDRLITAARPVWNWNICYAHIIQMILDGSWDQKVLRKSGGKSCWWGMDSGVIDYTISSSLEWPVRKDTYFFEKMIRQKQYSPFMGELHAKHGIIQTDPDAILSYKEILSMDWNNHNVIEMDENA